MKKKRNPIAKAVTRKNPQVIPAKKDEGPTLDEWDYNDPFTEEDHIFLFSEDYDKESEK